MKYKKYLKEKILEDGKIYEILNYQKTTNLFKIKMEEGIFLKFMVESIMTVKHAKIKIAIFVLHVEEIHQ